MSDDAWDIEDSAPEHTPDHLDTEKERQSYDAAAKRPDPVARLVRDLKKRDAMELMIPPPEKGQGRQIRGTIDVHTGLFIQRLISSRRWPWKDENAFVRSAIAYMIRGAKLEHDSEYSAYFRDHWELCRRARLVQRLQDVLQVVKLLEAAVRAYLAIGKMDDAVEYLRKEMRVLQAEESEYNQAALQTLESTFKEGGPALQTVWIRAQKG